MSFLKHDVNQLFLRAFDLLRGTSLTDFQEFFYRCKDRLESPMQVAVVGEICSSKSTMVNAMLGSEEVVRTGTMEETFNVSWLKYGQGSAPLKVYFKSPECRSEEVDRNQWAAWANRLGQYKMKDSVRYIEVPHDNPLLKIFNLIDTPGLNTYDGVDSQNTINFLNEVKPDAIVLLFTKSIAQRTVDVLRMFQGPMLSNITPINAIGVLTKIDDYWPGEPNPLEAGRQVTNRLIREEASIHKSLFRLYPISTLLALGTQALDDDDIQSLLTLAGMPEDKLRSLFKSARRFAKEDKNIPLSSEKRKRLANRLTRYGVSTAVNILQEHPGINSETLRAELLHRSGFDVFFRDVCEHFGNRAYSIKLSGIFSLIQREVNRVFEKHHVVESEIVREIGGQFAEFALRSHAFHELELLKKYFNGQLPLMEEESKELLRVTGEYGVSCRERLGMTQGISAEEMKQSALKRNRHWHIRRVTSIDPAIKETAKILEGSYREIARQINFVQKQLQDAEHELFGHNSNILSKMENRQ